MAGLVFVVLDPSNFWTQYLCSEMIHLLSLKLTEGLLMVMKVLREAKSFAKFCIEASTWFRGDCLPSRQSLLMSW